MPFEIAQDELDDAELLAMMDAPVTTAGAAPASAPPPSDADLAGAPFACPPALASALRATLRTHFGHDDFRPGQLEVIAALVSGRDACVYWSTGSGKSLCYQLPALHTGKTTLVVSPLISLMNDQVTHLNNTAGAGAGAGADDKKPARPLACFLGSQQTDPSVEAAALRGEYRVVYVTPEKIVGAGLESENRDPAADSYFLSRLREMRDDGLIGLVAVDEAHCVSQWGHDFRPSYRALDKLRDALGPPPLANANFTNANANANPPTKNPAPPFVALTATAVLDVRRDIHRVLRLRAPHVASNSVDRPNLRVSVRRKAGFAADARRIADQCRESASRGGSTIVYCPTVRETEQLAETLRAKVAAETVTGAEKPPLSVGTYHAQMSPEARRATHHAFLTGKVPIVVATVAFGMGIDKPDIRRVTHYGAPKTMEEYYQQIGRAGRDGLPSDVEMLYGDGDFARYASEFYVGKLTRDAREAQARSAAALERFARDREGCRRAAILAHFGESTPTEWKTVKAVGGDAAEDSIRACGACDACDLRASREARGDAGGGGRRDRAVEASAVLVALARGFRGSGGVSMTHLVALACDAPPPGPNGAAMLREEFALAPGMSVREVIRTLRSACRPSARTRAFVAEAARALCDEGFVRRRRVEGAHGAYDVFDATSEGVRIADEAVRVATAYAKARDSSRSNDAPPEPASPDDARAAMLRLANPSAFRVRLPATEAELASELEARRVADAKVEELRAAGVDVAAVPQAELDAGVGPAINAELQWVRHLRRRRERGRGALAEAAEELLRRVERWRDETAERLGMAPGAVLPSHVAKRVAYAMPTTAEGLRGAGVRIAGVETLAATIDDARRELGLAAAAPESETDASNREGPGAAASRSRRMRLTVARPARPWAFATYRPRKRKGFPDEPPPWEVSWRRFRDGGESVEAVATTRADGRAVQPSTVVGHLLEALVQGRDVDLGRALGGGSDFGATVPREAEWERMEDAASAEGVDPVGDPSAFSAKAILRGVVGAELAEKDRELKTEGERAAEAAWYGKIRVWAAMRRAGQKPEWVEAEDEGSDGGKRQRRV